MLEKEVHKVRRNLRFFVLVCLASLTVVVLASASGSSSNKATGALNLQPEIPVDACGTGSRRYCQQQLGVSGGIELAR